MVGNEGNMKRYILFGAGEYGRHAVQVFGKENIAYFVDNDDTLWGQEIEGISVRSPDILREPQNDCMVVITVGERYEKIIRRQLEQDLSIFEYTMLRQEQQRITLEKIQNRSDYIATYRKAIHWIEDHTIADRGICVSSDQMRPYPEVTGYFIPSLLRWGYRDLAILYTKWLCGIQKPDGCWYDSFDQRPYVFDTAQVLKGLLAIRDILPELDNHIICGCEWLISKVQENGRLPMADRDKWDDTRGWSSELIHLYCLSPLYEAAKIYDRREFAEAADRIRAYYLTNYKNKMLDFSLLSHFYAYVVEALLDIGEDDLAREAMDRVAKLQTKDGAVPGMRDAGWVCSTGLFQFALIWFRQGDLEHGNKAFSYACRLQNDSGGWFGSYPSETDTNNTYFPAGEISWANKFFLDALYYKNKAEFERQSGSFKDTISGDDERYQFIAKIVDVGVINENIKITEEKYVADIGCGKGAYLKNLNRVYPNNQYFAVDISESVMSYIGLENVTMQQGTLTNIPFPNDTFDMVYACESMEHAVDISSAIREMCRVTKSGGVVAIVDKNIEALGRLEIEEWEQWFNVEKLVDELKIYCREVYIERDLGYEQSADGLFAGWAGTVR